MRGSSGLYLERLVSTITRNTTRSRSSGYSAINEAVALTISEHDSILQTGKRTLGESKYSKEPDRDQYWKMSSRMHEKFQLPERSGLTFRPAVVVAVPSEVMSMDRALVRLKSAPDTSRLAEALVNELLELFPIRISTTPDAADEAAKTAVAARAAT